MPDELTIRRGDLVFAGRDRWNFWDCDARTVSYGTLSGNRFLIEETETWDQFVQKTTEDEQVALLNFLIKECRKFDSLKMRKLMGLFFAKK